MVGNWSQGVCTRPVLKNWFAKKNYSYSVEWYSFLQSDFAKICMTGIWKTGVGCNGFSSVIWHGSGAGCGVVEWVKRSTLKWFGHIERMENEEFVKKVYQSIVEGPNRKGRPLGRWEDKVKEYVSERESSGQGGRVWTGRGGDLSAVTTPLGDASRGSEASELFID